MAPNKDDLMSGLEGYFAKLTSTQNVAADKTAVATQEHYIDKNDLSMAKLTIEAAKNLDTVIKNTNKKYKEAVDFRIKSVTMARRLATVEGSQILDKEIKILEIMKQQYKVQERYVKLEALSNKMIGRSATKMIKAGVTGKNELGEEINSKIERARLIIGGSVMAALQGTYNLMLAATMTFVTALKTAWDGGIAGVMQVMVNGITNMVSKIAPGLGAALGAIGELFIKIAMMRWEDQIAKSTMGVKFEAVGGVGGKDAGKNMFNNMLAITGGVRHLAVEWGNSLTETSTNISKQFESDFYRMGRTMALSADQMSGYYKNTFISAGENTIKATQNLKELFGATREMAKKTGVDARVLSATIMDAAVSGRMFNIDMKSVTNTMGDLAAKEKNLAAAGVSFRDQQGGIVKGLVDAPKQWSMAMHAFAGMQTYGKEMGPAKAMIASMLGETAANSLAKAEGGGFTMGQGKDQNILENRLKMLTDLTKQQTAGMKDPSTAYAASLMLLEKFGITGAAATTVLAARDKGEPIDKATQIALMSQEEIQKELLTTSDRQEQIQRIIAGMVGKAIGLLSVLPDKFANLMLGKLGVGAAGAAAFDEMLTGFGSDIKKAAKTADLGSMLNPMIEGLERAETLKANYTYRDLAATKAALREKLTLLGKLEYRKERNEGYLKVPTQSKNKKAILQRNILEIKNKMNMEQKSISDTFINMIKAQPSLLTDPKIKKELSELHLKLFIDGKDVNIAWENAQAAALN